MVTTATDKKKQIISAAMKLWQQTHNVNKVNLTDIALEAGVSANSIYNLFGTRAGLIHEVIENLLTAIIEKQKAILKSSLSFPDKIQGMIAVK